MSTKDRVASTLSRDRLSGFIKKSGEIQSGCFYYALIAEWERMNPGKPLPKTVEEKILANPDLAAGGWGDKCAVAEINRLSELELQVTRVDIPPYLLNHVSEIRKKNRIPDDVPILRRNIELNFPNQTHGAILLVEGQNIVPHAIPYNHHSSIFQGEEKTRGNFGGQAGVDFSENAGLRVTLAIHLTKKNL